jgi:hypothetical protein
MNNFLLFKKPSRKPPILKIQNEGEKMKNLLLALILFTGQQTFAQQSELEKEFAAIAKAATHCGFLASFKSEVEDLVDVSGITPTAKNQLHCLHSLNEVNPDWLDNTLSERDFGWYADNQEITLVEDDQQLDLIGRPKLDFDIEEDDRPDFQ